MDLTLTQQLRALYSSHTTAKKILDLFDSEYERNMTATSVSNLAARTGLNETEIKEVCKEFERLKLGRYVPGRWNSPSRFEWAFKIKEVGSVACGRTNDLEVRPFSLEIEAEPEAETNHHQQESVSTDSTDKRVIAHVFKLRTDFEVTLLLPADLTTTEASRLARFVTSLPFDGQM